MLVMFCEVAKLITLSNLIIRLTTLVKLVKLVKINKSLPVVNVQDLTVIRGKYQAVESVSFKIFPGSNTAIIGPNGAGKSTLIQAILNLIPYASGNVEILGRQIRYTPVVGRQRRANKRDGRCKHQ